jgi:hypothetical protein
MHKSHMKGINWFYICVILSNPNSQYNDIMTVVILAIDIIIYNQRHSEFVCCIMKGCGTFLHSSLLFKYTQEVRMGLMLSSRATLSAVERSC